WTSSGAAPASALAARSATCWVLAVVPWSAGNVAATASRTEVSSAAYDRAMERATSVAVGASTLPITSSRAGPLPWTAAVKVAERPPQMHARQHHARLLGRRRSCRHGARSGHRSTALRLRHEVNVVATPNAPKASNPTALNQ